MTERLRTVVMKDGYGSISAFSAFFFLWGGARGAGAEMRACWNESTKKYEI